MERYAFCLPGTWEGVCLDCSATLELELHHWQIQTLITIKHLRGIKGTTILWGRLVKLYAFMFRCFAYASVSQTVGRDPQGGRSRLTRGSQSRPRMLRGAGEWGVRRFST